MASATTTNTNSLVQLVVVPPNGVSSFTLSASLDAPVSSVMADIATRTSIPVKQQVLTHGGVPMNESSTLRDLNVQNGARLDVSPSMPGGCGCSCCTIL